MKDPFIPLMTFERQALLEALRRDLRVQERHAESGGEYAQYHRNNARLARRLLEALNPKSPR